MHIRYILLRVILEFGLFILLFIKRRLFLLLLLLNRTHLLLLLLFLKLLVRFILHNYIDTGPSKVKSMNSISAFPTFPRSSLR